VPVFLRRFLFGRDPDLFLARFFPTARIYHWAFTIRQGTGGTAPSLQDQCIRCSSLKQRRICI
jgi:hypothetical protein